MEERIAVLKNTFIEILQLKETNMVTLELLQSRIKKIKESYAEFISLNNDKMSVFTLDSFHFQGRLIDIEYEDMKRIFLSITNRMYCDYYKLFKIIIDYVFENIADNKIIELIRINKDQYPVYKDLEPFKQYDIQYIQNLHELLLVILHYLNGFVLKKEHDLRHYQTKNKIGFNIDSFVHSFQYNNIVIREKLSLFVTFIEFFHSMHMKYLKRFTIKLQLMLSQVNNDIKIENAALERGNTISALNDLKDGHIDKHILRELKLNIGDDAVSISSDSSLLVDPILDDIRPLEPIISTSPIEANIEGNISDLSEDNYLNSPSKFSMRTLDLDMSTEIPLEFLLEINDKDEIDSPIENIMDSLIDIISERHMENAMEEPKELP